MPLSELPSAHVLIRLIHINFNRNFSFDDIHATGAQVIAKAAREAGVKRLIHVSALNASEESPSKFLQSKVRNFVPHFDPFHLRTRFSVVDKAVIMVEWLGF